MENRIKERIEIKNNKNKNMDPNILTSANDVGQIRMKEIKEMGVIAYLFYNRTVIDSQTHAIIKYNSELNIEYKNDNYG